MTVPDFPGFPTVPDFQFEEERENYRRGYLAALAGEAGPARAALTSADHLPWAQGYRAGLDALSYGFRE